MHIKFYSRNAYIRDSEELCQKTLYSSSWQTNLKSVIFGARTGKGPKVLFGPEDVSLEATEKARFIQPFFFLASVSYQRE